MTDLTPPAADVLIWLVDEEDRHPGAIASMDGLMLTHVLVDRGVVCDPAIAAAALHELLDKGMIACDVSNLAN